MGRSPGDKLPIRVKNVRIIRHSNPLRSNDPIEYEIETYRQKTP